MINNHIPPFSIGVDDILEEKNRLLNQNTCDNETVELLIAKPASQWMEESKKRPMPRMLFSEFWFEGELCILFADSNLGKSILAVQIGNSISKGNAIKGFKFESEKQPILYLDFELFDKQFEIRYSDNCENHYPFDENFLRIEFNPDAELKDNTSFEDALSNAIEALIIKHKAKILIIDNLTYLKSDTEKAKDALPLMKHLKALKKKYNLSILALAHTPKRDLSKPITRNDLSGSKMLINFCDSAFSIGESHSDKILRYIKQIKQRNTEQIYDSENVCVCQIDKPDNFLMFELIGYAKESDHLRQKTESEEENLTENIKALHQQGKSLREIGSQLGISHMKVKRFLEKNNIQL